MSATVEKALQIIEALSRSHEPVGVSQLGRQLHLNKSTVFRLMDTLCQHGYARKDMQTSGYQLTTKLWELGVGVLQQLTLRDVARPTMEAVTRETGETTMLGIVQDREALIVEKVDPASAALQIASPIGTRVALHCSSIGRALLAFQPDAFVEQAAGSLPRRTERTITARNVLNAELERVRSLGVAECVDEWAVGVSGLAAPIRDQSGRVVGSFCITGPTTRLTADRLPKLRLRAIDAAQEISTQLGYRPNGR